MTAPVAAAKATKTVAKKTVAKTTGKSTPVVNKSEPKKTTPTKSVVNRSSVKRTAKKTGRAVASKKRMVMPRIPPAKSTVRYRQALAAEIVIGSFLILSNANSDDPNNSYSKNVKAEAAFLVVMCVLSLLSVGGPSMARASAWLGGVIILVMMVRNPDIWKKFSSKDALPGLANQIETGTPQLPGSAPSQQLPPNNTIPNTGGLPYIPGLPQSSYNGGGGVESA